MPRLNSRKKGARGEKKICEVLNSWTGWPFNRVPQSGGLHWKTENTAGDVILSDDMHRFDFCVEVKNYKEINFEHIITPHVNSKIFDDFWPQCLRDSKRCKKIPLLMMRYDGIRPGDFFFTVILYEHFKILKPLLGKQPYLKYGKYIIMGSDKLVAAPYKKIKVLTEKIIKREYAAS